MGTTCFVLRLSSALCHFNVSCSKLQLWLWVHERFPHSYHSNQQQQQQQQQIIPLQNEFSFVSSCCLFSFLEGMVRVFSWRFWVGFFCLFVFVFVYYVCLFLQAGRGGGGGGGAGEWMICWLLCVFVCLVSRHGCVCTWVSLQVINRCKTNTAPT